MINKVKHCCVPVIFVFLILAVMTGCGNREAQFLIDGFQQARAEVDAEEEQAVEEQDQPSDEKEVKETSAPEKEQNSFIYVDVCGAVVNPGVFQLEEGSRVFQAIEAAGGYLPEASETCVNRAEVLSDGQQLYIFTREEMEQQGIQAGTAGNAAMNQPDPAGLDGKVNINTADESQLTTLTGIGATRAQAIIAYREENGPFSAIEDIMNVQGIKEGTFQKIKDDIVVG
ncbi:MAG: helix-hairpin-helix domain-containing protein [Clostridia bacterium]|nr:helix-hairpin-helix domain-containing protein [Clostridia bacterium]MDY5555035.1 helix-hairpin-helix domain-containing protein [Blautia sp.]